MSNEKLIYNGELLEGSANGIPAGDRGYQFGDGLFETIRIINGNVCFFDAHLNRLKLGLRSLKIKYAADFDFGRLLNEIQSLIELNNIKEGGRCRLTVTRDSGGYYRPKNEVGFNYLIQVMPVEQNYFELNEVGLNIDVYKERVKQITPTSNYKTLNCELYIMASIFSENTGMDDVLVQNDQDAIIESTNSNLFIVSNSVLYTVPLVDGCVGGTMRMQVINLALANNYRVYETSFKPRNLLVADEVFLTNASSGIRWVQSYRQKKYIKEITPRLMELVNASV
ncbi:MAG: branched-subunit amino acid aminotransferase/4-amino-4-deoxychorismate lyase [Patiriisocius sp.]|jgi:branched-subunit amino acid aminotransferase/4-amino-4-deoxychorismate lyase